jgi:signal transduction histidine kinase/DNA-binding response OmpR family regulator
MKLSNRLQLKEKLLLLGVLPAAFLAIILAVYFTTTRLNDTHELLHKTNLNLANSIAESAVSAVFSGNVDSLDRLLNSVINEPDIVSIKISDKNGVILSAISSDNASPAFITEAPEKIKQAIRLDTFKGHDDFDTLMVGEQQGSDNIIGYVDLSLTYDSIQQRQQDILLNSLYITLLLLSSIGLITHFISKAIGKPVLRLAHDVKRITQGDYNLPVVNYDTRDEISVLSSGIHDMALKIKNHQQTLQQKIDDATQELRFKNERLLSAQHQIVKSIDAKSRFVSHISHEIRTPLNGIIGFLEIMQSTPMDSEQQKIINASLTSSKNLQQIIDEVLDLAQLEAGKIRVKKTNFELKKTIEEALLILSIQAQSKGVTLDYQHDIKAPKFINQDPVKFRQILINLVNNAIKFSENSSVIISLKAHKPKHNHIEICVTDRGIGISEKNISKLFNEFTQLDNTTGQKGTGLGLVITKHILDALNGSISVTSVLGEGSVFCFSLPFSNVDENYDDLTKPDDPEQALPDLSRLTVLVADDNEINRLLLTHLLEEQNARVLCANDGQQALDLAGAERFDLMLLDLRMPFKMGNEALREIRNDPQHLNYKTPAIAITAHITSGVERAHHISSFDGYLVKPIDRSEFFKLIVKLIDEHDYKAKPFSSPLIALDKPSEVDIFDYDAAKTSMKADKKLMTFILNKFFAELPEQLISISADIGLSNYESAADTVHKVQGSCAYCGTPLLKIASKQLEIHLRERSSEQIPSALNNFTKEVKKVLRQKDAILNSIENTP